MKFLSTLFISVFLFSCSQININPIIDPETKCILAKIELTDPNFAGQTGYAGYCPETEEFIGRWDVNGVSYQVRRGEDSYVLQYKTVDGSWVEYSSKSGWAVRVPEDFKE